jgi:hypothetical protein
MNNISAVAIYIFCSASIALSQTHNGNAELPTAPFVCFPTGPASFSIRFEPNKSLQVRSDPQPPIKMKYLLNVHVVSIPPIQKITNTWSDGTVTEDWATKDNVISQSPLGNWLNVSPPGLLGPKTFPKDASDFAGVSINHFKGMITFKGKLCYEYTFELPKPEKPLLRYVRKILIDPENRLPVALKEWNGVYIYIFDPPPEGTLQLPGKYEEELSRYKSTLSK